MKGIIQKCVEELKKPKPRIEYVLGLLEAMSEMSNDGAEVKRPLFTGPHSEPLPEVKEVKAPTQQKPKKSIIPPGLASMMTPPDMPGAAVERRVV